MVLIPQLPNFACKFVSFAQDLVLRVVGLGVFLPHIHKASVILPSPISSPAAPTARTANVYSEKVKIFWISSVASSRLLTLQFQYEIYYSVEAVCNIV